MNPGSKPIRAVHNSNELGNCSRSPCPTRDIKLWCAPGTPSDSSLLAKDCKVTPTYWNRNCFNFASLFHSSDCSSAIANICSTDNLVFYINNNTRWPRKSNVDAFSKHPKELHGEQMFEEKVNMELSPLSPIVTIVTVPALSPLSLSLQSFIQFAPLSTLSPLNHPCYNDRHVITTPSTCTTWHQLRHCTWQRCNEWSQ